MQQLIDEIVSGLAGSLILSRWAIHSSTACGTILSMSRYDAERTHHQHRRRPAWLADGAVRGRG
jgi:hypothetical protein